MTQVHCAVALKLAHDPEFEIAREVLLPAVPRRGEYLRLGPRGRMPLIVDNVVYTPDVVEITILIFGELSDETLEQLKAEGWE